MSAILVLQAGPEINLSPLTERLWQARIPHRVIVENDVQNLWVTRAEDADQVKIWLEQWQQGELSKHPDPAEKTPWQVEAQQGLFKFVDIPVTIAMLVVMVICYLGFVSGLLPLEPFMLTPELWNGQKLDWQSFWANDVYRWWTPSLVHFSLLHLVMNGFWWWVLAKAVESHDGKGILLTLIFVLGVLSAFGQYQSAGPFFGGLSGINYGLMAWAWFRQRRYRSYYPDYNRYLLPSWLFPFMMIALVVMLLLEPAIGSNIGHESHLTGAIAGLLFALIWPLQKLPEQVPETEDKG